MRTVFITLLAVLALARPVQALNCNLDGQGGSLPTQTDVDTLSDRVVNANFTACANGACNFDGQGSDPADVGDVAALLAISTDQSDPGSICAEVVPSMPTVTYLRSCGSFGSGDDQLNSPRALFINPITKRIYVVDGNNNRVSVWDQQCNHLGSLGPTLSEGVSLQFPEGICYSDMDGRIAIVDKGHSRVLELSGSVQGVTSFGSFGQDQGQFADPNGCSFLANGSITVVDDTSQVGNNVNKRVQVFDAQRNLSSSFGQGGSADGQFGRPAGVLTLSDNGYLVVDPGRGLAQRFTASGEFINFIGDASGTGDDNLATPSHVTTDGQGRYYFTSADARIKVFALSGSSIGGFGGNELDFPIGIAYDEGVIAVSDKDKHQIHLYQIQP